jgi:uncharacterized protein YceH (UPF0502 family)
MTKRLTAEELESHLNALDGCGGDWVHDVVVDVRNHIAALEAENADLHDWRARNIRSCEMMNHANSALRSRIARLEEEVVELRADNDELEAENDRMRPLVESAVREGK